MQFMYTIFLAGIINIILSAIVLVSDSKNRKNISLSVFFLNLSLWDIFLFYKLYYGNDPYLHLLYATVSLLPVTSYYFLYSYIKKTEGFNILKYTIITFSSIFFILSLMRIMLNYLYHNILVLYLLFSFIAMDIFLLVEFRRETKPYVKIRLKYIFTALTILLILGSTDFMTFFNFLRPVMLGNIGTIIFVFMMAYIFIQKNILPIDYLLIKAFIYLLLVLLSGLAGYFVIYGWRGFSYVLYVKMLIAVLVIIILYKIMEEGIYRLSNKLLSLDDYKYQKLINSIEEEGEKGANLASLLKKIVDEIIEIMNLNAAGVLAVQGKRNEILYSKGEGEDKYLKEVRIGMEENGIDIRNYNKKQIVIYKIGKKGIVFYFIRNRGTFGQHELLFIETLLKQMRNAIDRNDMLRRMDEMQKIAFAGEVASGIAHDIRNPLSSIKGAVQYIEDAIPEEDKEYLDIIYEDINRIEHIIERFQIFAVSREVMKSETPVEEFIGNVKGRFKNKELSIENNIPDKSFSVDPILLEEIVYNIIQNAFDSYGEREGEVYMKLEREDDDLMINIIDHGKGINKKDAGKIFNPFYTTRINGIGLGLSITKKMINACGGTINYESNENGGTTFIIRVERVW